MAGEAAGLSRGSRLARAVLSSPVMSGGGLYLLVALMVANASRFLFHVAVSRYLVPASYGALGALLGIMLVLAVPATALQVAITKQVAARRVGPDDAPPPIIVGPLLGQAVVW